MKNNIRIVLVDTSHPGNIGATARAMKNMCLDRLYLVNPLQFPCAEATSRASGADDVLARAVVCASLNDALEGCRFVVATTARTRRLPWPSVAPRAFAARAVAESAHGEVAVVFGREHSGLTNAELALAHLLVHIPTNDEYSSLNLAAAVQILAYEILLADGTGAMKEEEAREVAGAEEMESFYRHLEQTLIDVRFLDPQHPKKLMRRLRRLYNRARPDQTELNILRGILTAAQNVATTKAGSEE